MAADDPDLVPKSPPARPERRDSAVAAALRRFDGEAAAPLSGSTRSGAWRRHPQIGLALAASLVLVIGIPAAVIVLRDQAPSPVVAPAPAPAERLPAGPQVVAQAVERGAAPQAPIGQPRPPVEVPGPTIAPAPEAKRATDETSPLVREAVGPPPAIAAAPPPPPPPAPMLAQKSAEGAADSGVIVTGSRIAGRSAQREERDVTNQLPAAEMPAAPDWVLKDRAYAVFLTGLQSAVRSDNRNAVIELIQFPLRVNFSSGSRRYRDPGSVRADYDRIFTPRVRRAVLAQRFDRLYGGSRGLMLGNGEIWFDHVCPNSACTPRGPVRITAINP